MSTPIPLTIGGKEFLALPPSFAFQKRHKEKMHQLQHGGMDPEAQQDFMAQYVVHCVKRATPDLDEAALDEVLDAVSIMAVCVAIGTATQRQIATIMGVDNLGEAKAGEA